MPPEYSLSQKCEIVQKISFSYKLLKKMDLWQMKNGDKCLVLNCYITIIKASSNIGRFQVFKC